MNERRFPPPWSVETIPRGLKVCDANGQSLAYVYSRENSSDAHMAKVLTEDEARRIASNEDEARRIASNIRQAAQLTRQRRLRHRLRSAFFRQGRSDAPSLVTTRPLRNRLGPRQSPHRHPPKSGARTTTGLVRRVYEEGPCRIKRHCARLCSLWLRVRRISSR